MCAEVSSCTYSSKASYELHYNDARSLQCHYIALGLLLCAQRKSLYVLLFCALSCCCPRISWYVSIFHWASWQQRRESKVTRLAIVLVHTHCPSLEYQSLKLSSLSLLFPDSHLINKSLPWNYDFKFVVEEISNVNDKAQVRAKDESPPSLPPPLLSTDDRNAFRKILLCNAVVGASWVWVLLKCPMPPPPPFEASVCVCVVAAAFATRGEERETATV